MNVAPRVPAERHRITCPYCVAGYAEVVVGRPGGGVEVEGFDEPRRCVLCKRYFRLRYQVRLTGVPLNGAPANGKVVTPHGRV